MNRDAWISLGIDSLTAAFFSSGICYSILLSMNTPVTIQKVFVWSLVIYYLYTLVLWNTKATLILIPLLSISVMVWSYLSLSQETWLSIQRFIPWGYHYMTGGEKLIEAYILPFSLVIISPVTLISFIFIQKRFIFFPLLMLALFVFLTEWYSGHTQITVPLFTVLFALVLLYIQSHYKTFITDKASQSARGLWTLWYVPLVCLILYFTYKSIPEDTSVWKWSYLQDTFQEWNDYYSSYSTFKGPRTAFTLNSTGFQPLGDRLGGPVLLNNRRILDVTTPYRVYLRGNIGNEYTGSSWKDSSNSQRYRMDMKIWPDQLRKVFNLELPRKEIISEEQKKKYIRDIAISITAAAEGPSTLFSPNRVYSIKMDVPRSLTYFNSQGELFTTHNVHANQSYQMQVQYIDTQADGFHQFMNDIYMKTLDIPDVNEDTIYQLYCQLPQGYPEAIYRLARNITLNKATPYDKALALESYMQRNFTYTLSPKTPPSDRDFVEYFISTQSGYCTYFASAMAVLARTINLPARYIEGFVLPQETNSNHIYEVTNKQAHAWVEIYFRGIGWIPFDPSPPDNSAGTENSTYSISGNASLDNSMGQQLGQQPSSLQEVSLVKEDKPFFSFDGPFLFLLLLAFILGLSFAIVLYNRIRFHPKVAVLFHRGLDKQLSYYYQDSIRLLEFYDIKLLPGDTPYTYADKVDQWLVNPAATFKEIARIIVRFSFAQHMPSKEELNTLYRFHRALDKDTQRLLGWLPYIWQRILRLPLPAKNKRR